MISIDKFSLIIEHAPLVAIDFIIKNKKGEVLLGKRTNEPAKGSWFVPGGRIYKNETLKEAQERVLMSELNIKDYNTLDFKGVFEHFYENSFISEHVSTHYVVLAFELNCNVDFSNLPNAQHSKYAYFELETIDQNQDIHQNTKNYFNKG